MVAENLHSNPFSFTDTKLNHIKNTYEKETGVFTEKRLMVIQPQCAAEAEAEDVYQPYLGPAYER